VRALPLLLRLLLPLLLALLLLLGAAPARADTPLALWASHDGRVSFTGTQVSLRTRSNNSDACAVTGSATEREANLSLPTGATVLSAQLYWAGSGPADYAVDFERKPVTAQRKYSSTTVGGGLNYFGGAADVTDTVAKKGSGTYRFSGLTVSNGRPWCASQAVLGGFSLLVVYSNPSEPMRILNLYEGFNYLQNSEVNVTATNFRWARPAYPVRERARIGHITWEGDSTLAQDGERLLFQGNEMTDDVNPEGNQFNSRSNININNDSYSYGNYSNSNYSYGIDFDAFDTSVVIWYYYPARVTTTYRTGQDLVLLNAEILVVPTLPVADLSIALSGSDTMQAGKNTNYTIVVGNNGPTTENGTITVTDTLPEGMSYVAASGANWSCAASGQTVTCTQNGPLAPGKTFQLTITAAVTSAGEKKNTVTVMGTDDDNAANNTATHTATAAAAPPPATSGGTSGTGFVFTDSVCKAGVKVGSDGACKTYGAAATVAGRKTAIFVTALKDGLPVAPSAAPSLQFALDCINPAAGSVSASYGGQTVPACAAAGAERKWSTAAAFTFPPGAASIALDFVYGDVGTVVLSLKTNAGTDSTPEFVVAPWKLAFRSIRSGSVTNPGNTAADSVGFVPAGTVLDVEIGALLDGTTDQFAPNFGNEKDKPAVFIKHQAIVQLEDIGKFTMPGVPEWAGGIVKVKAAWDESGAVSFVPVLGEEKNTEGWNIYQGTSIQSGKPSAVGRFYPAFFTTKVTGAFVCPPAKLGAATPLDNCLVEAPAKGAVYARQKFDVEVQAFNADGMPLKNYKGAWVLPIALSGVKAAGETEAAPGTFAGNIPAGQLSGTATQELPLMFMGGAATRATNWSNPANVFVRATTAPTPTNTPTNGTSNDGVSSLRPSEFLSEEGGVMVLNGRLKVPNALGVDTLRTPLALRVEYWAGQAGWLGHLAYRDTAGASADANSVKFEGCTLGFLKNGTCDLGLAAVWNPPQTVKLPAGAGAGDGVLWLRAPGKAAGASRTGSYQVRFNGWPWLPSTLGRVTFGLPRSPIIYMRETY
jgi:uncharacterized repeat protein (TIGR01451 family)